MRARFALPTLALVLTATLLPRVAWSHAKPEAHPEAGRAVADPIVAHGLPTAEHCHIFFGAKIIDGRTPAEINALEYSQVVGQPTTLENPDGSVMIWTPCLYDNGQPLSIRRAIIYYRTAGFQQQGDDGEIIPPDARLVMRMTNVTCGQNSSRPGPYRTPQEAACHTATGSVALTFHFDTPQCQVADGSLNNHNVIGNTADFSNIHTLPVQKFAYTNKGPGRKDGVCPASHPKRLLTARLTIGFAKPSSANITSSHGGSDFRDQHADYWQTWVLSGGQVGGLVELRRRCLVEAAPDHHSGTNIEVCGF